MGRVSTRRDSHKESAWEEPEGERTRLPRDSTDQARHSAVRHPCACWIRYDMLSLHARVCVFSRLKGVFVSSCIVAYEDSPHGGAQLDDGPYARWGNLCVRENPAGALGRRSSATERNLGRLVAGCPEWCDKHRPRSHGRGGATLIVIWVSQSVEAGAGVVA
eukprot:COSAG03_NODE_1748_length_3571_cov_1.471486_2_plen_162_part_00